MELCIVLHISAYELLPGKANPKKTQIINLPQPNPTSALSIKEVLGAVGAEGHLLELHALQSSSILSSITSASMSQLLSVQRSLHVRKFCSSSSAASGTSRCRSSAFPFAVLFSRGYGTWSHSSKSLQSINGGKRISSG